MSDPSDSPDVERRAALGRLAAQAALPLLPAAARVLHAGAATAAVFTWPQAVRAQAAVPFPTDVVTVLYRQESPQAPTRLDPSVAAAIRSLESEFLKRGFRVMQPAAEIYQLLDQSQGVVLTFAEDAGFTLVFSAYTNLRMLPGDEAGIAEMRLSTRVFVGRNILVAEEGRGQMHTRLEASNREFGARRAMELAAGRAAADVCNKASSQLRALSPQQLAQLAPPKPPAAATVQVVSPGGPSAPPPIGPNRPPTGVPAPVAPPPLAPPPVSPLAPAAPPPLSPPAPVPAQPPSVPPPAAPPPLGPPAVIPQPAPAPAAPQPAAELGPVRHRHALLVGMSDYSMVRAANNNWPITDLAGVAKDTSFVLESIGKLGFSADRVTVLRDKAATGVAVRGAVKQLASTLRDDDLLLIFIAGHGGDKEQSISGFGMPVLADYKHQDPSSLDYWELQSFVKNLRGRVVWVNDTCHSGGAAINVNSVVVSSRGVSAARNVRGPDAQTVAASAAPGQNFAILTACAPSELSLETAAGGLFTTRLFTDLTSQRGKLPLTRIYADMTSRHVMEESRRLCKGQRGLCADAQEQQTPIMAFNGQGDAIRF